MSSTVNIQMSPFWATVLSGVFVALTLSVVYGAVTIRDTVAANQRNTELALRLIEQADEQRQDLRQRMTTIETRIAIWEDRRERDAVWRPPMPAPEPRPVALNHVAYHKSGASHARTFSFSDPD
tara:strand:+ start:1405 stop:1776 length:372 start_codon:yes stop_codon:yes gene_type:complete